MPDAAVLARDPALLIPLAARGIDPVAPRDEPERAAVRAALEVASGSRLREELQDLLLRPNAAQLLQALQDTGVLEGVLPEVNAVVALTADGAQRHKDVWEHTKQVVAQTPARPVVRWAALLHDIGKVVTRSFESDGTVRFLRHAEVGAALFRGRISRRLEFPESLGEPVWFLIRNHLRAGQYQPDWLDSAVRRLYRQLGEHLTDLLDLSRADVTSRRPGRRNEALRLIDELARRVGELREADEVPPNLPPGLGNDIMQRFGLQPGPDIGRLRRILEQAISDGELPAHQSAETYLRHLEQRAHPLRSGG